LNKRRPDWEIRYAAGFQVGGSGDSDRKSEKTEIGDELAQADAILSVKEAG
jgi:hypothetical protein